MSHLCNINFISQYCYTDNKQIHVQEYISNKNFKTSIVCQKGHELILVNGSKRIPYFRHKNSGDIGGEPMTMWHSEWQSNFPII